MDSQVRLGGRSRMQELLSWAFYPYTVLFYLPFLGAWTLVAGSLATLTAAASARAAFHFGTAWSWLLCRVGFVRVQVCGREHIAPGQSYVIMMNHQSNFDILAFYGHWFCQFRWVLKEQLRRVPGLGWYCAAGGHIFVDRGDHEKAIASLERAKPLLSGGISVLFFPEGTRSRDGRLRSFKKGGFILAMELGLPILPVSVSGSRKVLPRGTLRLLPGEIRLRVHPAIDVLAYGPDGREKLMADVRAVIASGLDPWERGEAWTGDELGGERFLSSRAG